MTILIQLIQIITLQRRAQDLDYDQFSAIFYVVFTIGLGYLINSFAGVYSEPFWYSFTQNMAQVAVLFGLLKVNGKESRFVQTCTALFGVSALLACLTILVSVIPVFQLFTLLIIGWTFYLVVLIIKEALDCSIIRAVFLTIGMQIITVVAVLLLFPNFAVEIQAVVDAAQSASTE